MTGSAALSALDSFVAGNLDTTGELRAALGERALLERFLEVETVLAAAQADAGIIPPEAASALAAVSIDDLDLTELADRTTSVGYPVVGLVEQLATILPDGLGQYAHWGATTQDIMDTALVLQVRGALDLIQADLIKLGWSLYALSASHRDTPLVGRSQLQQASPTTFGYRVAGWLAPMLRHLERLDHLRPRFEVVELGGAVGTLAAMAPSGLAVRADVARRLDLADPSISWHSARDCIVELVAWAAQLTASLAKIGLDVALSSQTEVGELAEGGSHARGTSSTMPHKRNPILSQQLLRAARLNRTHLDLALDAAIADHDRATAAWSLEWHSVAPAVAVAGGAVNAAVHLLENLVVNDAAMAANLNRTDGLIMAEAIMMRLAPNVGRQAAHERVASMVWVSVDTCTPFSRIVGATAPQAADALDPSTYLGHGGDQVDAVLADAARILEPLDLLSQPQGVPT